MKQIKERIIRDIRDLFKEEKEDYHEPVIILIMKTMGERKRTLSLEEYLNKNRPYLKNVKNNLKKCDI